MSKKRITEHEFLDAKGRAVDRASTEATTLHYTVIGGGTLDFDLTALNKKDMSEVLAGFLHMGLTTAFNNAAAVKGGDPSPAGRFAHLQKRVKAWEAGEWSTGARGGDGASSLLAAAIVLYLAENGKPQSEEKVATMLAEKTREERAALRNTPGIKRIYEWLKAERALEKAKAAAAKAEADAKSGKGEEVKPVNPVEAIGF